MLKKFRYLVKRLFSVFGNSLRNSNLSINVVTGKHVKLYSKHTLINLKIGDYSYVAANSNIRNTNIGKFCSIGPNLLCGLAFHPIKSISTSPFFYSLKKQCGTTISKKNKIEEFQDVNIGNDVFIGANVLIIGGVNIGNGAVVGAGSVVTKNIPPYAVAVGNPIKIIKYRFDIKQIEFLEKIKWWDFPEKDLHLIEENIFDIDEFTNTIQLKK